MQGRNQNLAKKNDVHILAKRQTKTPNKVQQSPTRHTKPKSSTVHTGDDTADETDPSHNREYHAKPANTVTFR